MAVTLEELEIKFKSQVAAASNKDVAALQRVDAQVKAAQASLERLQGAARAAAQVRVASDEKVAAAQAKLKGAQEGFGGSANIAQVRAAQQGLGAAQKMAEAARARAHGADAAAAAQGREVAKIHEARGSLEKLAVSAGHTGDAQEAMASKAAALAGAMSIVATVAIAVVTAVAAAAAAVIAFGFAAASAARDMTILGLALTRSEAGGAEFVAIVNQLSGEIPLAREKIAGLAQEMGRFRLARRDLQAGLVAVGVVTSALGDSAGSTIKSLIEASAATRRFSLGARDAFGEYASLAGTGLKGSDVLAALSKELNRSVPDVQQALYLGQISVARGVRALEAAAKNRFGKVIELQMLSASTQFQKAREHAGDLFKDVNIEGALRGLREVLSVLDANTVTGRLLKSVLTASMDALGRGVEAVAPIFKKMFQGALYGALLTYVAVKTLLAPLNSLGNSKIDWLSVAFYAMAAAVGIFAAIAIPAMIVFGIAALGALLAMAPLYIGVALIVVACWGFYKIVQFLWPAIVLIGKVLLVVLAPALAVLAAGALVVAVVLGAIVAVVVAVGVVLYKLGAIIVDAFASALSFIGGISFVEEGLRIGASIIDALVSSIVGGAGKVLGALSSLGSSMIGSLNKAIGRASPPKRFLEIGRDIADATGMGVDQHADEATEATAAVGAGMTRAARGGAASGGSSGAGARGRGGATGGVSLHIENVYVGSAKATGADEQTVKEFFVRMLQEVAGVAGAGQPSGAT